MTETLPRLFIGLPLDAEGERGVRQLVEKLQKKHWKVRWEPTEKWHVTLAFLGVTEKTHLRKILRQATSGIAPFGLRFKGLDTWPRPMTRAQFGERWHGRYMRRLRIPTKPTTILPRLILVRLGGDLIALQRLATTVRIELRENGISFDEKAFKPHITIGRLTQDCSRAERIEIGKVISKLYNLTVPQIGEVNRLCLYESQLSSQGSRYQIVDEVKLA